MHLLIITWPIVIITLIFVIIIKIIILKYFWKQESLKKITISTIQTNMLLAFVGMPLLYLTYCYVISLPIMIALNYGDFKSLRVPESFIKPLDVLFFLIIEPGSSVHKPTSYGLFGVGVFITFIYYFYLSYKFELFYHKSSFKDQNSVSFKKAIKVANLISFILIKIIEIYVITLWYYDLYFI